MLHFLRRFPASSNLLPCLRQAPEIHLKLPTTFNSTLQNMANPPADPPAPSPQLNGSSTAPPPSESLPAICSNLESKLSSFLNTKYDSDLLQRVQNQTQISLDVVRQALDRYSFDELALSFNGGKDCLVLLILLLAALPKSIPSTSTKIPSVYVMSQHPFNEVDCFVEACIKCYQLSLTRYALPMKAAFATYLRERPSTKAIFVGTRRTDPHGAELTHFDMTDQGWPEFMRIHPVIDWQYQEVWAFLRELGIPYCELYDKGYTSLGGTKDTYPNPALAVDEEKNGFRPAYELVEDEHERLGRERK